MGKSTVKKTTKTSLNVKTVKNTVSKLDKFSNIDKIIHNLTDLEFKIDFKFINKTITNLETNKTDDTNFDKINNNIEPYTFDELDKNEQTLVKIYVKKEEEVDEYFNLPKKIKDTIQFVNDGYARGISRYINTKFNPRKPLSNAYVKLWEIYNTFDWVIPKSSNLDQPEFNSFHMCEAPGQWINTTATYFEKNKLNTKYNWYANSLNPTKFKGNDKVIKDDYGFIKNNKSKWIWGADDTGDITNIENIKWYHKFLSEKLGYINLISGDAGLPFSDLFLLQKLELAQMVMVACTAMPGKDEKHPGSSCIIKHFLPFMTQNSKTKMSAGLFMSIMYMYHLMFEEFHMFKPLSSSPGSGEFYVVARNFRGISDNVKTKLLSVLSSFKINRPFFAKEDLPESFKNKVIKFINIMMTRKINTKISIIEVLKCINNQKSTINCNYYLGPGFRRYKEADMEKYIKKYKLL
jgi:hypothetical protein